MKFFFDVWRKKDYGFQLHKPRHRPVIAIKCADLEYGAQFYFELEKIFATLCPTEWERPCFYMDIGPHVNNGSPLIDTHSKDNFDAVFVIEKKAPVVEEIKALDPNAASPNPQEKTLNASQFMYYMLLLHNPHNINELREKLTSSDGSGGLNINSYSEFQSTQFTVQHHVKKSAKEIKKPRHYFGIWGGMGPVAGASVLPEMIRKMKEEASKSPQGNAILGATGFAVYSNPAYSAPISEKITHLGQNIFNVLKRAVSFLKKPVDAILITSNTLHTVFDKLQSLSGGKCSNIVEEVTNGLKKEGQAFSRRTIVLGTTKTRDSKLYQKAFNERGLEYIGTTDEEQKILTDIIALIKNNKIIPAQEKLLALMAEIKNRTHVRDFLFACTELPIPYEINKQKFSAYTVRDSKTYLVNSLVERHFHDAAQEYAQQDRLVVALHG